MSQISSFPQKYLKITTEDHWRTPLTIYDLYMFFFSIFIHTIFDLKAAISYVHSKCPRNDSSKEYKVKLEAVCIRLILKSNRFEISVPLEIFFVYIKYFTTVSHRKRKVQFVLPQSDWLSKSIAINSKFSNHVEISNLCWRNDLNQIGSKFRYNLIIWTVIGKAQIISVWIFASYWNIFEDLIMEI